MILDTNAISDFADANKRLLDRIQQADDDLHLPVIVLGEYRYGLKSSRLRVARESWLDESNPRRLCSPLLRRPVVFMPTSVMSSALLASRFPRTIFGSPRWRGSTDCRFSVTMRILIKSQDLVESVVTALSWHRHVRHSTRNTFLSYRIRL